MLKENNVLHYNLYFNYGNISTYYLFKYVCTLFGLVLKGQKRRENMTVQKHLVWSLVI